MNSKDWKYYKIKNIAEVVGGGTPSVKINEYWGGKIPWITPKDLSINRKKYITGGERYITEEGLAKSSAKLLPPNSLLFSSRAPIGYLAINKNSLATNQGFKSLIPKKGFDIEFLYYLLIAKIEEIKSYASGSTFQEISGSVLKNISLKIPDLKNQKKISDILSTIDKKIELNLKINKNLEETAKTLFKSWFVDFDPVREKSNGEDTFLSKECSNLFTDTFQSSSMGEIPKGWKITKLSDLCSFIQKGISPDYTEQTSYPVINQKCIRNLEINFDLCKFTNFKKIMINRYLSKFDILVNSMGVGTLGRIALFTEFHSNVVVDACISVIRAKDKKYALYLFQNIIRREKEIINLSQGSTGQTTLKTQDLGNLQLIEPPKDILELYYQSVKNFYYKKNKNNLENNILNKIREILIPKLTSEQSRLNG